MPVEFVDPVLQLLAEKLLRPGELELLIVNGGTVLGAMVPTTKKAAEHLEEEIKKVRNAADRMEVALVIYKVAEAGGLSLALKET